MSDQAKILSEGIKRMSDSLDESDAVRADSSSSAILSFEDGKTHRISSRDCRRVLQSEVTVKQLCDVITTAGHSLAETSIELEELTIPEDALFALEELLAVVEEV